MGGPPVSCLSINRLPRLPSSEFSAGSHRMSFMVPTGTNWYVVIQAFRPRRHPGGHGSCFRLNSLEFYLSDPPNPVSCRHGSLKQPSPQTSLAWFQHAFTEELCSLSRRAWGELTNIHVSHHGWIHGSFSSSACVTPIPSFKVVWRSPVPQSTADCNPWYAL